MASLINKASNIVAPTSSSVSYAIMDQGGNLDANFNSVVCRFIIFIFKLIFISASIIIPTFLNSTLICILNSIFILPSSFVFLCISIFRASDSLNNSFNEKIIFVSFSHLSSSLLMGHLYMHGQLLDFLILLYGTIIILVLVQGELQQ